MSTELILLGTAGGPTPRSKRFGPSQAILVDGVAYVIDCGSGVLRQLFHAGVAVSNVRCLFVTHHHSDHNADLGNFFLLGWSGLSRQIAVFGPPPLARIIELFVQMSAYDINIRVLDEGKPPLGDFIGVREVGSNGLVYEDERVAVTAMLVDHPPLPHAFAYRFDTEARSIVISGDTRPLVAMAEFARGADVLVHEAMCVDAIASLMPGNNGARLREHLLNSHTTARDAGGIAAMAGVSTLVLSHLTPSSDIVSDEKWQATASELYNGHVIVGSDLMIV